MADELYNGDLTYNDNWADVNGKAASGEAVQKFIKDELKKKIQVFHSLDNETTNVLLGFTNNDLYAAWKAATTDGANDMNGEIAVSSYGATVVNINKATPQPYYTVSLENKELSNQIISTDGSVKIKIQFNAVDMRLDTNTGKLYPVNVDTQGKLVIKKQNTSGSWSDVNLVEDILVRSYSEDNPEPVELDLTHVTDNGVSVISLSIVETRNVDGVDKTYVTTELRYRVTKTTLAVTFASEWNKPFYLTGMLDTEKSITLNYYIEGIVHKYLRLKFTCTDPNSENYNQTRLVDVEIGEGVYTVNNQRKYSLTLSDNDSNLYKVTRAGVHNVEAYIYTMSGGKIIAESEHIYSQFLVIDSDNDTKPYIILNNINKNLINWTTQNLFEYAVYKQGANISTLPVHILLTNINDDSIKYLDFEENVNILQKKQYSNTLEIDSSDHPIVAKLSISVDNVPDRYISVASIDNTGGYAPTAGADFIFNPKLYSNNFSEDERKTIRNAAISDRTLSIVPAEWSDNFNFNNDAWVQDSLGNKCLRVLGGQELKINYNPFSKWYSSSPNNTTNSGTIEMVFATRNIVDENYPLIRMCKYKENDNTKFNGWELKPLIGLYKTFTSDSDVAQDVWLHEDVITHVAVVVDGGFSGSLKTVKIYINGIINREFDIAVTDIENGMLWDKPEGSMDNSDYARNIIIGNKDSGSDIDVYSIKVYKNKALTSAEVMQNYMSSLFTKEEKEKFRTANDILDETTNTISYEKCQKLGYNTILWRYRTNEDGTPFDINERAEMLSLEKGHDGESEIPGELVIHKYNYNAGTRKYELDPYRSGIIEHILAKGQGTSSMTYWKWNQRWQFDKIKTGEKDAEGESITYDSTFHPMILGERGWTNERIEQEKGLSQEEIASIQSKYVRSAYQICEGVPFAQRLDGKINWASPMQSHKLGSVNLYNDVWKEVIGSNDITNMGATESGKEFTNTDNGYNDCRVAIVQEPFFVFNQPAQGEAIKFYGLYTVGPSKGDKPTFGYNKNDFVDYLMMEGMDNGAALVNCAIPWNNDDIGFQLNDKGEEIEHYGNKKTDGAVASGWEISMGKADKDRVDLTQPFKVNPVLDMFKDMINFCYEHSHKLKPFNGNYNDFISPTNSESIDTSYFYWMTTPVPNNSEHKAYNLYRFDTRNEQWVHAGINRRRDQFGNLIKDDSGAEIIQYEELNLAKQLSGYLPENWNIQSSDSINKTFINARVTKYKGTDDDPDSGIRKYLHVNDLRYTMQMLKLIAASDNWAKNTYIYNPGVYKEDMSGNIVRKHGKDNGSSIVKGAIIKVSDEANNMVKQYGAALLATDDQLSDSSIQKYKLVSKFGFFQDDLDTILSLNNTGQKVKPYYTEEHDVNDVGKYYWNADENPLFRLPELAWPDEMQSMMYSILTAMANLARNETGETDKVVACFDKYYGKITKYFPAVAYNTITSLLYESAFLEWNPPTDDGVSTGTGKYANGVNPLSQAVGDQSLGERYWFRRRSIYISSYAGYGTWTAGDGNSSIGAVVFRSNKYNGADSKYEFHLTTSMWLYPRMTIGQDVCFPTNKAGINGYKPRFRPGEEVVIKGKGDGNTNVVLCGRDYYKSFGDWGKTIIDPEATAAINGSNLLEFVVTKDAPNASYPNITDVIFDPDKITISAPNLQKINIPGTAGSTKHINGDLNLQNSRKIKYVDITGTNLVGLKLPDNSNIEVLRLPAHMTALNLTGLSRLTADNFSLSGTADIVNVTIKDCPKLNEYNIVKDNFISKKAPLTSITLNNLNWVKTNKTRGVLTLDELKYLININNCDLQGVIEVDSNDIIDFGTKLTLLDKFGNIDSENNKLRVIYKKLSLASPSSVKITGYKNIYTTGYYAFNVDYYSDVNNRIPANDFYEVKWSINNTKFGTIDEKTGVYHYIDNPSITDKDQRKVTISCTIKYLDEYNDEDIITKSLEIELFKALAKVGDYVYADGSYSPAEEYAGDKKIIAVCFMAEESGSNVTPDNQKRLAVCYETIKDLSILKPSPTTYSGFHKRYWGDNTKDVPSLVNYEYAGIVTQGNISGSLASIVDGSWSDVNKLSSTIADYYEQYYPLIGDRYALSNIGWKTYDMTGTDTGMIEEGDIVSQGFLNTIYIINQRNSILGDNKPKEDNYNSEFANFVRASENGLSLSYYNAASYCYSYEPFNKNEDNSLATVQGLDDKFKKHNWYLPSIGELLILWRYLKANVGTTTGVYKGFGEVLKNNLSDGDQSQIWSSTESSSERAYNISAPISKTSDNDYLYGNNGIFSSQYGSKSSNNYYILPIVKF